MLAVPTFVCWFHQFCAHWYEHGVVPGCPLQLILSAAAARLHRLLMLVCIEGDCHESSRIW